MMDDVDLMMNGLCESPIEVQFLRAYLKRLPDFCNLRLSNPLTNDKEMGFYTEIPAYQKYSVIHELQTDFVWTQFSIEKYRCDFLLGRVVYGVEFIGDQPQGEVLAKTPLVVVECDGHDFHERTKEQARRDKSRDRKMVAAGYSVLRFTGSELHRDPDGCAQEVDKLLFTLAASMMRK